VASVKIRPKKT